MRYEYSFLGKNEVVTRDFLMAEDPYDLSSDEKMRARWLEESKHLFGNFVHTGPQRPIAVISKSKMKEIVDNLKKLLLSDWNDVNFVIGTNP